MWPIKKIEQWKKGKYAIDFNLLVHAIAIGRFRHSAITATAIAAAAAAIMKSQGNQSLKLYSSFCL